jgi:molybdopterin-guanine dinucleotide biosynthesis protein A
VNAFILAGGQSTRMGRDKTLLLIDGRPLIEHMIFLLRGLNLEPCICGSRSDLARYTQIIPDNFRQAGPLAGMEAALAVSDSALNLFVPVDLPGLPAEFLRWLMERGERSRAVATIPHYAARAQPLCAVYSSRLLTGLRRSMAAGDFKVMAAIREAARDLREPLDEFDVESVAASGPAAWPLHLSLADWFRNVNTPADYDGLQAATGAKGRHPIS